jgi:hypothetical protein
VDNPSAFTVVREFRQKCSNNDRLRKASPISLFVSVGTARIAKVDELLNGF